ncbi:hypothetical protein FQA39_LY10065 [Lamprigera yunnana]|nr:hypothetical protein FQA39_LY10065 [Lamprigera yunnana]
MYKGIIGGFRGKYILELSRQGAVSDNLKVLSQSKRKSNSSTNDNVSKLPQKVQDVQLKINLDCLPTEKASTQIRDSDDNILNVFHDSLAIVVDDLEFLDLDLANFFESFTAKNSISKKAKHTYPSNVLVSISQKIDPELFEANATVLTLENTNVRKENRQNNRTNLEMETESSEANTMTYEWGKLGLDSKVAVLHKLGNPSFEVEEIPYAELWMGTHANAPSEIKETGKLLSSLIQENPSVLGEPVRQYFGDELPFLLKILSIRKALSIQVHPSKDIAKRLHAERPDIYKDPNHKPEFAIALTKFQALCGFRPIEEIKWFMKNVRELRAIVGTDKAEKLICSNEQNEKDTLKLCFRSMMMCSVDVVKKQLKQMLFKFSCLEQEDRSTQLAPLLENLYSQFPDDIGCFAIYFLNHVILKSGEALYLAPNEPHAYLSGDCVECMACSDNIVRAGLTPKYKDVETLCTTLNYICKSAQEQLLQPTIVDSYCELFKPPVPDFAVVKIEIPAKVVSYNVLPKNSASILIVISGRAKLRNSHLIPGTILFFAANEKLQILDVTSEILLFQAFANVC